LVLNALSLSTAKWTLVRFIILVPESLTIIINIPHGAFFGAF